MTTCDIHDSWTTRIVRVCMWLECGIKKRRFKLKRDYAVIMTSSVWRKSPVVCMRSIQIATYLSLCSRFIFDFRNSIIFFFVFFPVLRHAQLEWYGCWCEQCKQYLMIKFVHFRLDIIERMFIVNRTWGFIFCLHNVNTFMSAKR